LQSERVFFDLERSLHSHAVRSNPEAVAALLSDDFREFGASGRIWTKPEIIAELASEAPTEIKSRNFECQILSPELALITYLSESPTRTSLRSSLWRFEDGRWRILFHQGTPIPSPP
jgi:glyoxylase I family protein